MTTGTAQSDAPARESRRWVRVLRGPGVTAAAVLGALAVVFTVDPNEPGNYPLCPFHAVTGLDCPGCGATRGLYALMHGDVGRALDHNVLLAVAVPLALLAWVGWVRRAWTGRPVRFELPKPAVVVLVVVLVLFWVVRNIPGVPYLPAA